MKIKHIIILGMLSSILAGCQKFLDNAPLPTDKVLANGLFNTDVMAGTAVTGVFLSTSNGGSYGASGGSSLGYTMAFWADEMKSAIEAGVMEKFYKNTIQPADSQFWKEMYQKIYMVNTAIEGINSSKGTLVYKDQWLGECYFLRGLFYCQLVNIYGSVPLALTTKWETNNRLPRSSEAEVHQQIIADLSLAKSMLSENYKNGNGQDASARFRPNKAAASTMLAKMYLYTREWNKARSEATTVIENNAYSLVGIDDVFLLNSKETIWSLANNTPKQSIPYQLYNKGVPATLTATQTPKTFNMFGAISDQLLAAFEPGDSRLASWTFKVSKAATATAPALTYYIPNKYKSSANTTENQIVLRLAEVYLIRAEAKYMLSDPSAVDDLNAVHKRAGLGEINPTDFIAAVTKERQAELFTENGQRFFDLKRLGIINDVMKAVAPTKVSTWEPFMAYWPIPSDESIQNPNITPNPGYAQ